MNEEAKKVFEKYFIESGADKINGGSETTETLIASKRFSDSLKKLPHDEKVTMQEALKVKFKQLSVPGAVNILRAVFKMEEEEKNGEQKIPEIFILPKPWPDSVNGEELFNEISSFISAYIILSEGEVETITLFLFSSYFMDSYDLFPYLHITSPSKGCGKTKLLEIVECLLPCGYIVVNPSIAALFRAVDKFQVALCFDEIDQALNDEEILGFLVSSYRKKDAEGFLRSNEKGEVVFFSSWGPKVLSGIGPLKIDTLRDRTIQIPLVKKRSKEKIKRLRSAKLPRLTLPMRQKLIRFAQDNSEAMGQMMDEGPKMPDEFDAYDRPAENWEPLIASADLCSEELGELAREIAIEALKVKSLERQSHGEELLKDMLEIFIIQPFGLHTKDLVEILKAKEDRPWAGWNKGFGIKPHNVAALLGLFKIKPKNLVLGGEQLKGYKPDDFKDVFDRYSLEQSKNEDSNVQDGPENRETSTPNSLENQEVSDLVDGKGVNLAGSPTPIERDSKNPEEDDIPF